MTDVRRPPSRPPQICEACFEALRTSFISQTWLYCEHHRVMARRRRTADRWTLDSNVSQEKAQAWVVAALQKLTAWAAKRGQSVEDNYLNAQKLFERNQATDIDKRPL